MKILLLHGWESTPGGLKPTYLKDHGHTVLNPALPDDDFDAAVRIGQAEWGGIELGGNETALQQAETTQPEIVAPDDTGPETVEEPEDGDQPEPERPPARQQELF